MSVEAMKLALAAFETLTQYNMVRANIFRRFEPTCTGDYVDLREFREKAAPVITALQKALAQPQQEPVAWAIFTDAGNARMWSTFQPHLQKLADAEGLTITPLYTSPPARKPLTDEEMEKIAAEYWLYPRKFVRVIEAAHGIKENT